MLPCTSIKKTEKPTSFFFWGTKIMSCVINKTLQMLWICLYTEHSSKTDMSNEISTLLASRCRCHLFPIPNLPRDPRQSAKAAFYDQSLSEGSPLRTVLKGNTNGQWLFKLHSNSRCIIWLQFFLNTLQSLEGISCDPFEGFLVLLFIC